MGRPLSMDLRGRTLAAVDGGMSRRAAAGRFGVSVSSVIRWDAARRATGGYAPEPQAAFRRSSRETVDGARSIRRAISRTPWPWARRSAISSRSANDSYLPEGGCAHGARCDGGIPPASLNHRDPTAGATPASRPASSLVRPAAIACQNRRRSSRFATPGRPSDRIGSLKRRSTPRFRLAIAPSITEALRRPVETAQYACDSYRKLLKLHRITASMSRKGNCLDNAPMESFFSSLKTEMVHRTRFRTRREARAALFEYIEIFYNRQRRHSSIGYRTPAQARMDMMPKMAA